MHFRTIMHVVPAGFLDHGEGGHNLSRPPRVGQW